MLPMGRRNAAAPAHHLNRHQLEDEIRGVGLETTRRICFLHIGTHKTGTTSIQRMLAFNEKRLDRAGSTFPRLAGHPASTATTTSLGNSMRTRGSSPDSAPWLALLPRFFAAAPRPSALAQKTSNIFTQNRNVYAVFTEPSKPSATRSKSSYTFVHSKNMNGRYFTNSRIITVLRKLLKSFTCSSRETGRSGVANPGYFNLNMTA